METNTNNMQAKKKIIIFMALVIVTISAFLLYYRTYGRHHIKTENAYTTGDQNLITAQISGSIVNLSVKNTDKVEKGQLLASIEDTDYRLRLEEAKINLGKSVRDFYSINIRVDQDQEILNSARSDYNTISKNYKRETTLFEAGLVSKKQIEDIENKYIAAKNNLNKAIKQYDDSKLKSKSKDIMTHPSVAAAILNVKKAYLDLSRTKVYSPIDGKVAKKSIYLGEQVGRGQELLTIVDLEKSWVEANLKETQLKNIQIGNYVELTSDLNKKTYKGVVVGISGGSGSAFSLLPAQNATGNWIKITQRIPVRIALTSKSIKENGVLPLGSTMEVDINTNIVSKDIKFIDNSKLYNPYVIEEKNINNIVTEIIKENSLS